MCSHQHWEYEEKEIEYEVENDLGETEPIKEPKVVADKPCIDLRPVENIRIHPNADWRDPIGTSPYIIDLIPMYVYEVEAMIGEDDPKTGQRGWKKLEEGVLRSGTRQKYDTTRTVREGDREDKVDPKTEETLSDYDVVWVHRNIMRDESGDVVFYTLGTEHLLSDPIPVEEEYSFCEEGERPYTMGVGVIESHKLYPDSLAQIGFPSRS